MRYIFLILVVLSVLVTLSTSLWCIWVDDPSLLIRLLNHVAKGAILIQLVGATVWIFVLKEKILWESEADKEDLQGVIQSQGRKITRLEGKLSVLRKQCVDIYRVIAHRWNTERPFGGSEAEREVPALSVRDTGILTWQGGDRHGESVVLDTFGASVLIDRQFDRLPRQ